MSAFSNPNFQSENYFQSRPQYPQALFDYVYKYHQSHQPSSSKNQASQEDSSAAPSSSQQANYSDALSKNFRYTRAVDLACGPGEATVPLSRYFSEVIGVDTSSHMIETAKRRYSFDYPKVTFMLGSAEDFINDDFGSANQSQPYHYLQYQQQQQRQQQSTLYTQYPNQLQQPQLTTNPDFVSPLNYRIGQPDGVTMPQIVDSSIGATDSIDGTISTLRTFQAASNSIDMITVAEGAHWFDLNKFYSNAWRALKPNGTLAIWGYCDPIYEGPGTEEQLKMAAEIQNTYIYGSAYLGPYWERPGRTILQDLMVGREPFQTGQASTDNSRSEIVGLTEFSHVERHSHVVTSKFPETRRNATADLPDSNAFIIKKVLHLADVEDYLKSSSAYFKWKQEHFAEPDILEEMMQQIRKVTGWTENSVVTIVYDVFLILATK